ncbi:MAG: geranylgeranyl reductase family protein [Actinomycetota bacterium]
MPDFDVAIVGGGPAGSTAAYHLASRGRRVVVIDKARFPRDKVCGDGLTPRAVKCLRAMGVSIDDPSWARADGLRIIGGGVTLELPWPELDAWPQEALVRTRLDFDSLLLEHARKAGAEVWEETEVTSSLVDDRGVVTGVAYANGDRGEVRAPIVIASDGVANRFGIPLGVHRIPSRPMGVAVRTYFHSPRWTDTYLESYLELWRGSDLLPGYGWIFPLPDGTVNVGLGLLNTSKHFQAVDYKKLLWDWVAGLPAEWGLTRENQVGKIRGGSLPMGFNRAPLARPGLMLVGDAAGAVNPFNGEGIAYAMETAAIAADVADEALRAGDPRALRIYPERLRDAYEGYFILGRTFVKLIGHAPIMSALTRHGLKREWLMRFAFKILANLTEPRDGAASDRLINALVRNAPAIDRLVHS